MPDWISTNPVDAGSMAGGIRLGTWAPVSDTAKVQGAGGHGAIGPVATACGAEDGG